MNNWELYRYAHRSQSSVTNELKNNSTISSFEINLGESILMTGSASGGIEPYQYAYYYKRSTNPSWIAIGTEYSTETTATLKPTSSVSYDIRISVRDSTGQAVSKEFSATVIGNSDLEDTPKTFFPDISYTGEVNEINKER